MYTQGFREAAMRAYTQLNSLRQVSELLNVILCILNNGTPTSLNKPKMYPVDRRRIAINIYHILESLRKTACMLQVSHSTIHRWIVSPDRKQYSKRQRPKTDIVIGCIANIIRYDPFSSLRSIQHSIEIGSNTTVSLQLIRSAIKSIGITKKKARFHGKPSRIEKDTVEFVEKRNNFIRNGHPFVSLDETSFGRNGAITRGYSKKGEPLFVKSKPSRMTTTSVLSAVSSEGKTKWSTRVGSFDRNTFLEALKSFSFERGTVVLLDNVSFHHSKIVKDFSQEQGIHLLYVPAYSPWFNPIEGVFSVVKRHFYMHRCIDGAFRTVTNRHVNAFFDKSFSLQSSPELIDV